MYRKDTVSNKYLKKGLPKKQLFAERLAYSLDFARRAIQHLIVDECSAPVDALWYVRPEKIIAESAFLLVYAKTGNSYKKISRALNELIEILEPLARSKATLYNICLKPALALDYAHAHICLNYLGIPDKEFDAVLKHALKHEKFIERTSYRMLEQEWLLGIWNNSHKKNGLDFWIPQSCLNHTPDLFSESSDGVYGLTHAIMYSTFNSEKILNIDVEKLIQQMEGLLIRYMDEQDYDISGELLMAWTLLKKPFSRVTLFALECLINIEKRVGFLPAPNIDLSMIEGKEQSARRTYIYSINYHTAYVMGLLSGSMLKNLDDIEVTTNEPTYPTKLNNWLKKELSKGKQVHWIEYFTALNDGQKNLLTPWVYQALLARNVKQHKYGNVKKMLDLVEDSDLESLEMSKQAGELIQRLDQISKI